MGRTGDGAVYDGAILQLDGHRLIVQFHQKPRMKGDKEKNMNETNRRVRQILTISTLRLELARNEGLHIPYELHFDSRIRFPGGGERD